MIYRERQFGSRGSWGVGASCYSLSRNLQLVPCRNLGCFITVEHKVVLRFRGFSTWHLETTISDINLQTIRKISRFHF